MRWRLLLIPLLWLMAIGVVAVLAGALISTPSIRALSAGPSPYLLIFQAHNLNLPSNAEIEQVLIVDLGGERYEILEYRSGAGNGLQIKNGNRLINDPDIAFEVLLAYAWTPELSGLVQEDIDSLAELEVQLDRAQQEYMAFFELAEALTPVVDGIDDLKDRTISGIPQISVGPLPIIDITNVWDLLCTIPLNIFDLCLLEPLVREIHEQGTEIELLLVSARDDLALFLEELDRQAHSEIQDGLTLKLAEEKAYSSLNNLLWKLDEFQIKLTDLYAMNLAIIDTLENKRWGTSVGAILALLQNVPGLNIQEGIDGLVIRLKALDTKLVSYLAEAQQIEQDISTRVLILRNARNNADEALQFLAQQWRARPAYP